jgi:hypothetical protein
MNPVEIEKKIIEDLKTIRTPEELKALQKWARHAKKNPVHEPKLQNFGKINYTYEYTSRGGSGSKARYHSIRRVEYCYFTFLGLKIILEENNNSKYKFSDELFDSKQIWGDRKVKYIGWEFYPKQEILEWDGCNIQERFFQYLKEKKYHLVETPKKLYLSNSDSISQKIIMGRRLRNHEKENSPSFSKSYLKFFEDKGLEIKTHNTYYNISNDTKSELDDIFNF